MSLIVKRACPNGNSSSNSASPIQRSSLVHLEIFNKNANISDISPEENRSFVNGKFWFINTEPLTFTIDTSWKDGPGASIAGKIDDLTNSWLFKVLGGENLFTAISTDSWSQKIAEKGSPIAIKLKFRAYHESVKSEQAAASHSYLPFIYWFTRLCAPPKQYSLLNGAIRGIAGAFENAKSAFEALDADTNTITHEKVTYDGKEETVVSSSGMALSLIKAAKVTGLAEPDPTGKDAVRGQYTLRFTTEKFGYDTLDWIVKSFSWTPSQQMIFTTRPEPLWVDFDIDLETNICPSNAYVAKFLAGKKNKI